MFFFIVAVSHMFFLVAVSHEFQFIIGVLHYIQARLSAPATIQAARETRHLLGCDDSAIGSFLNLHCGHNNPFGREERQRLEVLLYRATASKSSGLV